MNRPDTPNRPRVVVCSSASIDGRITIAPDVLLLTGEKRWDAAIGSNAENTFERLKAMHKPQATLEGSRSFIRDGDQPAPLPRATGDTAALYQDYLPESILKRPGHAGWFTAVDGRGRIRWLYKEYPDEAWKGWYPLVLVGFHTPADYLAYLRREEIPYLVAGQGQVDLRCALEKMRSLLGVTCVLSTAGGRLNGALLRAGLVDEINIDYFPAVIGGFETPSLFDSPDLKPDEYPTRLKLMSAQVQRDGHVWLRYEVVPNANL